MLNFSKLSIDLGAFLLHNKKHVVNNPKKILVALFSAVYLELDFLNKLLHKLGYAGWLKLLVD